MKNIVEIQCSRCHGYLTITVIVDQTQIVICPLCQEQISVGYHGQKATKTITPTMDEWSEQPRRT